MASKLNLTSQIVLENKFTKDVKGYSALEVDMFLDRVIEDYQNFEKFFEESKNYILHLEKINQNQKNEIDSLRLELAKYQSRFANLNENSAVNRDNIELIQKINALQKALHDCGVDPSKIK